MDSWERFNETSLPDKTFFTVNYMKNILLIKTIYMLKEYLINH